MIRYLCKLKCIQGVLAVEIWRKGVVYLISTFICGKKKKTEQNLKILRDHRVQYTIPIQDSLTFGNGIDFFFGLCNFRVLRTLHLYRNVQFIKFYNCMCVQWRYLRWAITTATVFCSLPEVQLHSLQIYTNSKATKLLTCLPFLIRLQTLYSPA